MCLSLREWANGNASVGDAMKSSVIAHAVARESSNLTSKAVARSVGQAVAAAHMADHSMGAALYALKAVKHAGKSTAEEIEWQNKRLQQLPSEIVELVLTTMTKKARGLKIW